MNGTTSFEQRENSKLGLFKPFNGYFKGAFKFEI